MGGSGSSLQIRNYNGGIELINKSGPEAVSIDLNSGQVILDSTVTNGDIVIRGIGKLTDNSQGATVDSTHLVNPDNIADAVWNATVSEYQDPGTFGHFVSKKLLSVAKFLGLK